MDNYDSILERRIQSQSLILLQAQEIGGGGKDISKKGKSRYQKKKKSKEQESKGKENSC